MEERMQSNYKEGMEFPVVEMFYSIQGEGKFAGVPSVFIRLAGCTRQCPFCDTDFKEVKEVVTLGEMKERLKKYRGINVVWTGGEPLLHWETIKNLASVGGKYQDWHIETNGDLLTSDELYVELSYNINYLVVSPKCLSVAKRVHADLVVSKRRKLFTFDIKVATDLGKVTSELLPYATMIMPLTFDDEQKTQELKARVVEYALKHNLRYTPRLHVDIWGFKTKGV